MVLIGTEQLGWQPPKLEFLGDPGPITLTYKPRGCRRNDIRPSILTGAELLVTGTLSGVHRARPKQDNSIPSSFENAPRVN